MLPSFAAAQEQVQFSWALLVDRAAGQQQALDASMPISLASGSTLQVYIEQQPGTYVYLYLLDSAEELHFLFPEETNSYNSLPAKNKTYRIPPGTDRFTLVPPSGQEKLYLMASSTRLAKLEKLTAEYLAKPQATERKGAVIQEMKKIRRLHSRLAQITETSVPVAGTVRTRDLQGDLTATRVSAMDFYSKIIRLNHE